jgi:hypothetical protein
VRIFVSPKAIKLMTKSKVMTKLIAYTNQRLALWYSNAKAFGIEGSGVARHENSEIVIDFVENGVQKTWAMHFDEEQLKTQTKDWVFNCWAENAGND